MQKNKNEVKMKQNKIIYDKQKTIKKLSDEKNEMEQLHKAKTLSIKEERDSYKRSNQSIQSQSDSLKVLIYIIFSICFFVILIMFIQREIRRLKNNETELKKKQQSQIGSLEVQITKFKVLLIFCNFCHSLYSF